MSKRRARPMVIEAVPADDGWRNLTRWDAKGNEIVGSWFQLYINGLFGRNVR